MGEKGRQEGGSSPRCLVEQRWGRAERGRRRRNRGREHGDGVVTTPTGTCPGSEKCGAGVSGTPSCSREGSQGITSSTGIHLPTPSPSMGGTAV